MDIACYLVRAYVFRSFVVMIVWSHMIGTIFYPDSVLILNFGTEWWKIHGRIVPVCFDSSSLSSSLTR
jgi:hypothetical protein